ncbi:MAG: uracil-DNA glycosylase [Rhodocyclaceae bacterium]|nr:uracil-DNA glycosylase [Rhodocyclaceae bacterium]
MCAVTPWQEIVVGQLGLGPVWRLRDAPRRDVAQPHDGFEEAPAAPEPQRVSSSPPAPPEPKMPRKAVMAQRAIEPAPEQRVPAAPVVVASDSDWDALEHQIRNCTACVLHQRRKQAVPGIGDRHPRWLLVGEGPGAEEDRRGEPFVGPAGRLLDAMLAAAGLSRQSGAFIANSVKCRPPGNRTPETDEIATCFPYLRRQVELLAPRVIVALGRPAAQSLLDRQVRIADARGQTFSFEGVPVIVTYHPAYLLRNPHDKGKAWEDLCRARQLSDGT